MELLHSVCSKHIAIIIINVIGQASSRQAGRRLAFEFVDAQLLCQQLGFGQLKYRLSFNYNATPGFVSMTNFHEFIKRNLTEFGSFILHSISELSIKMHNLIIAFQFQQFGERLTILKCASVLQTVKRRYSIDMHEWD